MVDSYNQLKLFIDEQDQGVAAADIPPVCYAVLDLYGQCKQVRLCIILKLTLQLYYIYFSLIHIKRIQ